MNVDFWRTLAAIIAATAGALRLVPLLAGYLSRRRAQVVHSQRLALVGFTRRPPWHRYHWPPNWDDVGVRRRFWRKSQLVYAVNGAVLVGLTVFSTVLALRSLDSWSALVGYAVVAVACGYMSANSIATLVWVGRKPEATLSPMRRDVTFVVAGSRRDVFQYSCAVLVRMGATLVSVDEAAGTIQAAMGVWVRGWQTGQRIDVSVTSHGGPGRFEVTMASDDVHPDHVGYILAPHRRHTYRFLDRWTFTPVRPTGGSGEG